MQWSTIKTNYIILFTLIVLLNINKSKSKNIKNNKILSRHKRYLVFPEGASLSVAICMTSQMGIAPGQLFTEGLNWGINYDLPNDTRQFREIFHKDKQMMRRRYRRDLYSKLETIMNSMGYSGRSCILRTLCEVPRLLSSKGKTLLEEIIRIIFDYPITLNDFIEDDNHRHYNSASHRGRTHQQGCHELFPNCPFSLIDLIFGYYSHNIEPPDDT